MIKAYQSMHHQTFKGATLIELVVSIVIISITLVGVLSLFLGTTRTSADPMVRTQSLAIAQSYMDEILMQPYATDGATAGRANYNEVDDYNAITAGSTVQDQFGNTIAALSAYQVEVNVSLCTAACGAALNSIGAKKVTVIVSHTGLGTSLPFTAYRTNY